MNTNLMKTLLEMVNQFRVYHWMTKSYAKHQAFGGLYDSMSDLTDKFMEVFMGKYGRPTDESGTLSLSLKFNDEMDCLNQCSAFLQVALTNLLDGGRDTDLLNIRDEMVAEINRAQYLLTLS